MVYQRATAPVIPPQVRTVVALHAATVRTFNAELVRLRHLETRLGSPGRYEWEYRLQAEPHAAEAQARLCHLEACALAQGVSREQLYAHVPAGRPTLAPWSVEALGWT